MRELVRTLPARVAPTCACAVLALSALEVGYRVHTDRPVLTLQNWRAERISDLRFGVQGRFDVELGWAPRDAHQSPGYSTLRSGIRRNHAETDVRTGGILAVGDEFTNSGDDVADDETWPAQLERLIGAPVLNGGVPGYATDQIVARAERLLPLAQPETIVVALFQESIRRAGFSVFGEPKPYCTMELDELACHPPPQPADEQPAPDWPGKARDALGYSAILDVVLAYVVPVYWLGDAGAGAFRTVDNDPVAVTCALLARLKRRADAGRIRVLLLMQHARKAVTDRAEPGEAARKVSACAGAMGLEVVDQFPTLHAVATALPAALDNLYLPGDGASEGRMSPQGNRATADLLARTLGKSAAHGK